jgi:hypothetical protein
MSLLTWLSTLDALLEILLEDDRVEQGMYVFFSDLFEGMLVYLHFGLQVLPQ